MSRVKAVVGNGSSVLVAFGPCRYCQKSHQNHIPPSGNKYYFLYPFVTERPSPPFLVLLPAGRRPAVLLLLLEHEPVSYPASVLPDDIDEGEGEGGGRGGHRGHRSPLRQLHRSSIGDTETSKLLLLPHFRGSFVRLFYCS